MSQPETILISGNTGTKMNHYLYPHAGVGNQFCFALLSYLMFMNYIFKKNKKTQQFRNMFLKS